MPIINERSRKKSRHDHTIDEKYINKRNKRNKSIQWKTLQVAIIYTTEDSTKRKIEIEPDF